MKKLAVLALILALAACGGDATGPKTPSVSGGWTGTVMEAGSLNLTLVETSGTLTGSGSLSAGTFAAALTVTGAHAHPNVSLTMKSAGYEDMNFAGTMTDDRTIAGTLNGSGFSGQAVTLRR